MNTKRWRKCLRLTQQQEYKISHYYFNLKIYKQVYKIWLRAVKLNLTNEAYWDFAWRIGLAKNGGFRVKEMHMNSKQLDRHLSLQASWKKLSEANDETEREGED